MEWYYDNHHLNFLTDNYRMWKQIPTQSDPQKMEDSISIMENDLQDKKRELSAIRKQQK